MKFLLDTNVVSELRKRERADRGVREWFSGVTGEELALSVLVLAEIRLGILRRHRRDPEAARHLATWLARIERSYRGRTLAIDGAVAAAWADLNAARPLPVIDSLLAATALVHGLVLVTRDARALEGIEVPVLDPFTG